MQATPQIKGAVNLRTPQIKRAVMESRQGKDLARDLGMSQLDTPTAKEVFQVLELKTPAMEGRAEKPMPNLGKLIAQITDKTEELIASVDQVVNAYKQKLARANKNIQRVRQEQPLGAATHGECEIERQARDIQELKNLLKEARSNLTQKEEEDSRRQEIIAKQETKFIELVAQLEAAKSANADNSEVRELNAQLVKAQTTIARNRQVIKNLHIEKINSQKIQRKLEADLKTYTDAHQEFVSPLSNLVKTLEIKKDGVNGILEQLPKTPALPQRRGGGSFGSGASTVDSASRLSLVGLESKETVESSGVNLTSAFNATLPQSSVNGGGAQEKGEEEGEKKEMGSARKAPTEDLKAKATTVAGEDAIEKVEEGACLASSIHKLNKMKVGTMLNGVDFGDSLDSIQTALTDNNDKITFKNGKTPILNLADLKEEGLDTSVTTSNMNKPANKNKILTFATSSIENLALFLKCINEGNRIFLMDRG